MSDDSLLEASTSLTNEPDPGGDSLLGSVRDPASEGVQGEHGWPPVTVIMPVLNEERHLEAAVERVLAQDYEGPLEVVLAVGPSRDRTQEVSRALASRHPNVHIVDNPTGKTPAALNAAIAVSVGDVIVRVDGHAMIPSDYVSTGIRTLEDSGADNVGGIMAAEGTSDFECAVARAMTSRFGVGGASFHVGGEAGLALTVYLGCYRRAALEMVGGFDESMERAQDWELNLRIRQGGGIVWFTPLMRVTYRPRHSVAALARQYFDYGRWRREVANRHPETVSLRYLAAPVTVLAMSAGLVVAVVGASAGLAWLTVLGLSPSVVYAGGSTLASVLSARTRPRLQWSASRWLPVAYATMHMAWGVGFLRGGARSKPSGGARPAPAGGPPTTPAGHP